MNKLFGILVLCFLLNLPVVAQHRAFFDYELLLSDIEESLKKGEKRALRDLGTILDIPDYREQAVQLFKENVIFPKSELVIDINLNKATFLDFYYSKESKIQFSTTAKVFFLPPLTEATFDFQTMPLSDGKEVDPSTLLRGHSATLLQALSKGKYDVVLDQILKIQAIGSSESFAYLRNLCNEKQIQRAKQNYKPQLIRTLVRSVAQDHRMESLESILKLIKEEHISPIKAQKFLTELTNVNFSMTDNPEVLISFYNNLQDSLGTLYDIRQFGYSRYYDFSANYFEEPVDYYGKILCDVEELPWISKNALSDLMKIGHPRAMMHIAANIYKNRTRVNQEYTQDIQPLIEAVETLSNVKIGFKSADGTYNFGEPIDDLDFQKNYFLYWLKHWEDYTWDENTEEFVNKMEAAEQEQSYEKLFRRLGSKKDSIAIAAYLQLTEGNPEKITELSEKYRQLLRNYNKHLPSFKFYFLESLTRFTDYCRNHQLKYKPEGQIRKWLNEVENEITPQERIALENKIIESLTLENVSMVEYWASLREPNKTVNYSIGRILDKFYSKNWKTLISDEAELRHYLKKSYLFEQIGVIGVCNAYLKKFDLNDQELSTKLQQLFAVESDGDIANQLEQLIDQPSADTSMNLDAFIEDPTQFGGRDIKVLPSASDEEAQQIVAILMADSDLEAIKKVFFYLRLNPNASTVPTLMKLIEDDRVIGMKDGIEVSIGMNTVPLLERIYGYSYPAPEDQLYNQIAWKSLWQQDSLNYRNWGITFLAKELTLLEKNDTLSIVEINQVTNSLFYDPILKERCIKLLAKVYPVRDIRKFQIEPKLSVKEDLRFFAGFRFSYKELDDIPKLFEVTDPKAMMAFLIRESEEFSVEDLGSFYNKLFTLDWFAQYVNGDQMHPNTAQRMSRILNEYLEQSDFISEFEEQSTNLHIAQLNNIGKPLADRLANAVLNDLDDDSKFTIQQSIIAGISYDEIGIIINYIDQLSNPKQKDPLEFLRKDFGLPIFDISNPKKFISDHSKMDQKEFYLSQLESFGVDIISNKKLDLAKVYELLEYDIVSPFVGGGGAKRDYYVYGVIKVLELEFNESLGFHEKLNENQSFYSYTSSKRAAAWMQYIRQNGLIKLSPEMPPSFNYIVDLAN